MFVAALSVFWACNNDDNNGGANPVIGTWKLVEEYYNGSQVALSNCDREETYIFGPEQFTHELYENTGRFASPYKSVNDSDDEEGDDEESDDHSSDDGSDDHNSDDNQTDESTDDGSDDNGGGGGNGGSCINNERVIGTWTSSSSVYSLTSTGATEVVTITFIDANSRFYIEKTTTVNGSTVVRRYVYQKQ
ncbi:hypothetical protein SAMN05444144_11728 [Flavobacterium akiainvivens]|nr:hypothetical protein SAMN05444144_11728 [Flavobacterium akiainvivens]